MDIENTFENLEKTGERNFNKAELETIIDELEMSMELEERADEVRKILNNLE